MVENMKIIALNKKASFEYFIEDKYEAGIVLTGTEIKSIRLGKCNINDAYVRIKNVEAYIINMNISKFAQGNIHNHEETRERKLLLHKNEILKLSGYVDKDGYTLIPLKLYLKEGLAKIEVGVCRGKKLHDKRDSLKEKDMNRRIEKQLKQINY